MSVGYPDYARLSQAGGTQLFGHQGGITNNLILFEGYVGSWPYVNLVTNGPITSNFAQINLVWFSDSTFTTSVGFRFAIRGLNTFAQTQYANLSPWLRIFYESDNGSNLNFPQFGLFATTAPAGQIELASLDVPIIHGQDTIPAGSGEVVTPGHIQPGAATFQFATASPSYSITFNYFDWTAQAFVPLGQILSNFAPFGGFFDVPMLDAPMNIAIHNGDTASRVFTYSWMSK